MKIVWNMCTQMLVARKDSALLALLFVLSVFVITILVTCTEFGLCLLYNGNYCQYSIRFGLSCVAIHICELWKRSLTTSIVLFCE